MSTSTGLKTSSSPTANCATSRTSTAMRGSTRSRRRKGQLSQADLGALVLGLPRLDTPNLAFRNRAEYCTFEVSKLWDFDTAGISQGMALADLDGDGDLDGQQPQRRPRPLSQ